MATMDIFTQSAFNTVSLTAAFQKLPYQPALLGDLGIFEPTPSRTRHIAIERRNGFLSLVPTTPIGAPVTQLNDDKRDIRDFRTVRLAKGFTIYAEELNGIRQFGSETELMQVQEEVARRAGRVKNDMELTEENMRLGALRGVVYDADGQTVIRNWYTEWGISAPSPIVFALGVAGTDVRSQCAAVVRQMARAAQGAYSNASSVHALCGDAFYDALIDDPSVKATYLNWSAALDLRQDVAFQAFTFAGITFHNYRGTDDQTTVTVPSTDAFFFPMDAPGVFQVARGPAEFEPWVNTLGQESYAITIPDRDRQAWTKFEQYTYPLHICTRPETLLTGKRLSSDPDRSRSMDFAALVLGPAMAIFGDPITVTPLASQPGGAPFPATGIFRGEPTSVQLDDGTVVATTNYSLGIRLTDFTIPPAADDQILVAGTTWSVDHAHPDGQGGSLLTLKRTGT